jgi:SAM-dependent methyltransferase
MLLRRTPDRKRPIAQGSPDVSVGRPTLDELHPLKRQQQEMWTVGDYATFAQLLQPAADALVARVGVTVGTRVLDVATGTGNAAIAAAGAGGRVTGLDLTPELFDAARGRARAGGWDIDWIEGDAEHLPFADQSFERVLSVFGVMFAPDHRRAARELARVLAPGGSIGVCSWTIEGAFGRMIRLMMSRQPPASGFAPPPGLWGNQPYVTELFSGHEVTLSFERDHVVLQHDSAESWIAYLEQVFGPVIFAKAALQASGGWDSLRADLVNLYSSLNESTDGSLRVPAEYLTAIVVKNANDGHELDGHASEQVP